MIMRLQKFLANAGVASRRKCEELISDGAVKVNGSVVTEMGVSVDSEKDVVVCAGKRVKLSEEHVYIMLNKPCGCVSTCSDDKDRDTVMDYVRGIKERIYPVGRLDFTSEGLLLMTSDGELANRLTHPRHEVTKRYMVVVDSEISPDDVKKLESGVFIEGGKTAPAKIKLFKSTPERTELTIIIHEGRNRQIRRMFEAIEKNVVFLKRISVGDLNLDNLKKGAWRYLTEDEIKYLKSL